MSARALFDCISLALVPELRAAMACLDLPSTPVFGRGRASEHPLQNVGVPAQVHAPHPYPFGSKEDLWLLEQKTDATAPAMPIVGVGIPRCSNTFVFSLGLDVNIAHRNLLRRRRFDRPPVQRPCGEVPLTLLNHLGRPVLVLR